jgi:hypothetical protein
MCLCICKQKNPAVYKENIFWRDVGTCELKEEWMKKWEGERERKREEEE